MHELRLEDVQELEHDTELARLAMRLLCDDAARLLAIALASYWRRPVQVAYDQGTVEDAVITQTDGFNCCSTVIISVQRAFQRHVRTSMRVRVVRAGGLHCPSRFQLPLSLGLTALRHRCLTVLSNLPDTTPHKRRCISRTYVLDQQEEC